MKKLSLSFYNFICYFFVFLFRPSWSNSNVLVSEAGRLRLKFRPVEIERAVLSSRNEAEMGPANSLPTSA